MAMADDRDHDLDLLEAAFGAARAAARGPVPDALMARVLADAGTARSPTVPASAPAPRWRGLRALVTAFGGWPALGGLATATVAGFWLGFAPPAPVEEMLAPGLARAGLAVSEDGDLSDWLPAYDLALLAEEG